MSTRAVRTDDPRCSNDEPSTNVQLVVEPLLDNPRLLTAKVAAVLGGKAVERPQLTGLLNSEFDPFLNQLFAAGSVTPREAAEALDGHPGFIWLAEELRRGEIGAPERRACCWL